MSRAESRVRRMRRGVSLAARVHQEEATRGGFRVHCVMQTLTYAPGVDWRALDVSEYRRRVVSFFARRGVVARCVWVMEMQARGAPHFHVLWWLPKWERLPMADRRGWWRKGMANTKAVASAVGYVSKGVGYVSKGGDGGVAFPKGVRIHGAGGLSRGGRAWRAWERLPAFVRAAWPERRPLARRLSGEEIRNNGPGFVDEATGELVRNPWRVISIRRGVVRLGLALSIGEGGSVDLSRLAGWELRAVVASENAAALLGFSQV